MRENSYFYTTVLYFYTTITTTIIIVKTMPNYLPRLVLCSDYVITFFKGTLDLGGLLFSLFIAGWSNKSFKRITMDTFPVPIESLFERKSA